MPVWSAASVPFFFYVLLLAALMPGLPAAARSKAAASAAAGLLLALTAGLTTAFWLRGLILPPLVLLIAYRASGFLWRGPMFGIESALVEADRALRVPLIARRMPRPIAEFLELAYGGVYPLIPIALALHLAFSDNPDADHFWTVVLVTDYVCFGMLPLIQTRPPRHLEPNAPWHARFRVLNLNILNNASIGMNTVPSGHAAEAVAAALLVLDTPPAVVAWMFFNALAISAGAVFGRYHYAIDALAGWVVAVGVWAMFR
jgi:PAP2 superfamily protein